MINTELGRILTFLSREHQLRKRFISWKAVLRITKFTINDVLRKILVFVQVKLLLRCKTVRAIKKPDLAQRCLRRRLEGHFGV